MIPFVFHSGYSPYNARVRHLTLTYEEGFPPPKLLTEL